MYYKGFFCQSVKAIINVCKYNHKGSDQATFSLQNDNDEVEKYLNGRYVSTSEALWRISQFPIHERFPAVVHLAVHLQNGQRINFNTKPTEGGQMTTPLKIFFKFVKKLII